MKVLFKKRWCGIPIGIASIVLALMLVGGGVLASYMLQNGNAEVTVLESISVTNISGGDDGNFDGAGTWAVTLYPGQSKHLDVLVSNASPVVVLIGATANVSSEVADAGISALWSGLGTVGANGSITITLTVTATGDISPTTTPHLIYFEIVRG